MNAPYDYNVVEHVMPLCVVRFAYGLWFTKDKFYCFFSIDFSFKSVDPVAFH